MKKKYQNIGKIVFIIIMGIGLLYAFWNLLSSRFLLGENKKEVEMATEKILSSVKNADRMECYTWVYRDLAEEELWDPQYDVKMVHDFEHQKFQTMKADKKEIIDYTKEDIEVYSRGISPVYIPDGEGLRTALLDRWLKYEGAKTYGKQQEQYFNRKLCHHVFDRESHEETADEIGKSHSKDAGVQLAPV